MFQAATEWYGNDLHVVMRMSAESFAWRDDIVNWGFTIDPTTRTVQPNTKPGLGVEIDEAEVAKHPFEQEVILRSFNPDGAVTDW